MNADNNDNGRMRHGLYENPIVDSVALGRCIQAARMMAGYKSAQKFADAILDQTGLDVSKRVIFNVESGRQFPSIDLFMATLLVTNPPGGVLFFRRGWRPEIQEQLNARGIQDRTAP